MNDDSPITEALRLADLDAETCEACGKVSHDEARAILSRFVNSHFKNPGEHARVTIPADPKRDDDLRMAAYIARCRVLEYAHDLAIANAADAKRLLDNAVLALDEVQRAIDREAWQEGATIAEASKRMLHARDNIRAKEGTGAPIQIDAERDMFCCGEPIWPRGKQPFRAEFSLSCGWVIVDPYGRESTLGYANQKQAEDVAEKMTYAYWQGAYRHGASRKRESLSDNTHRGDGAESVAP